MKEYPVVEESIEVGDLSSPKPAFSDLKKMPPHHPTQKQATILQHCIPEHKARENTSTMENEDRTSEEV